MHEALSVVSSIEASPIPDSGLISPGYSSMARPVAQSSCVKLAGTCHLATIPVSDPREKPPRSPRREATCRSPNVKGFTVWRMRVGGQEIPRRRLVIDGEFKPAVQVMQLGV